jgi:hypothetical protein
MQLADERAPRKAFAGARSASSSLSSPDPEKLLRSHVGSINTSGIIDAKLVCEIGG